MVKVPLHSNGAASNVTALLLGRILPVYSLVAPCQVGASPFSVRRATFTTDCQWLSVLEASDVVFVLALLHANVSKRLIQSPKLFFVDVGLAAYLLGIENQNQIFTHPLKGGLFENLVVIEALKHRCNRGLRSNLHFYRDSAGHDAGAIDQVSLFFRG